MNNITKSDIRRGLIGQWKYHGAVSASGTWHDVSGNGLAGTLAGSATVSSTGVNLNGSTDCVTVGTSSNLSFEYNSVFSISAWVKCTAASGGWYMIFAKDENSSNYRGYYFTINNNSLVDFAIISTLSAMLEVYGSTTVRDSAWHHVVCTYDGSHVSGGVKLYVNGALETMTASLDALSTNTIINSVTPRIGSRDALGCPFPGIIDDVRIYNRALSADEIKQIYYITKGNH